MNLEDKVSLGIFIVFVLWHSPKIILLLLENYPNRYNWKTWVFWVSFFGVLAPSAIDYKIGLIFLIAIFMFFVGGVFFTHSHTNDEIDDDPCGNSNIKKNFWDYM